MTALDRGERGDGTYDTRYDIEPRDASEDPDEIALEAQQKRRPCTAVDVVPKTTADFRPTVSTCVHNFHIVPCSQHIAIGSCSLCFGGATVIELQSSAVDAGNETENEINSDSETAAECICDNVQVRMTGDCAVDRDIVEFYRDRAIEM